MKKLLVVVLSLLCAALAVAQTPADPATANFPARTVGLYSTWNQFATPQVGGGGYYAQKITDNGHPTYLYNSVDIVSITKSPFRVMTVPQTGIAQYVTTFQKFQVFALGQVGVPYSADSNGTNVGMSLTGGGFALVGVGHNISLGPLVKVISTTLSDRQYAVGLLVNWGSKQ